MTTDSRSFRLMLVAGLALSVGAFATARQDAPKPATPPPAQEDLTNPITGSKPRANDPKPEHAPGRAASGHNPSGGSGVADKDAKQGDPKHDAGKTGETQTITAGGLTFDVPATWLVETPTRSMFTPVAQFRLPAGKTGASEDANVKVFTGIRGGVEPNLERWKAQIQDADKPAEQKVLKVNGLDVHVLYTGKGGFNAGVGMQTGGGGVKKDFMILGAIVVTPDGDVQFKATGPAAILEQEKSAWEAMVKTIRAAK